MSNEPILNLLGLAKKAGRLELGEEPVGAVCRSRHARLVLLAQDAASNTHRRAAHFGQAGNVLWLELPFTKAELGRLFGRNSCALLALTDVGFAASLAKKLAQRDPERYSAAAAQLQDKAGRMLQRQQEQRRHEKKLQRAKQPWLAPPKRPSQPPPGGDGKPRAGKRPGPGGATAGRPGGTVNRSGPANPAASRPAGSIPKSGPGQPAPAGAHGTFKPGPGRRHLSGAIPKKRGGFHL